MRSGVETGMAFLPVEVMVEGLDLEKRGRIMVCRRKSRVDSSPFSSGIFSKILSAIDLERDVDHGSHEDVNAMTERSIW